MDNSQSEILSKSEVTKAIMLDLSSIAVMSPMPIHFPHEHPIRIECINAVVADNFLNNNTISGFVKHHVHRTLQVAVDFLALYLSRACYRILRALFRCSISNCGTYLRAKLRREMPTLIGAMPRSADKTPRVSLSATFKGVLSPEASSRLF